MGIDLSKLNQQLSNIGYQQLDANNQPVQEGNDYINGVPKSLVDAVIKQESAGNPKAVSKAGAVGMMQLMRDTATDLGLVVNDKVDERLDPDKNIAAGTKYLKTLYDKYNNWEHTLAAYNWGPGNVDKWLANGANKDLLPEETRNYVATLSKAAPKNWAGKALEGIANLLGGEPIKNLEDLAVPGTAETTDIDYVEQGALNSMTTDMWNSFKKGIDETQKSFSFGKLDDYQEIVDNAPDEIAKLESAKASGELDEDTYRARLFEINSDVAEAKSKVSEYEEDVLGQEKEISKEPVSKRYQLKSQITQAAGSSAGTWDSFRYTLPETAGSSASLMGQQLAATFGGGVAKNLIAAGLGALAPEPIATKIAAGTALATAVALLANSRNQETYSEIGDAIQTNQSELLNEWSKNHPGQEPTDEDLRRIRQQARVGKNDLYWQNMALAIPDLAEAVLLPGSSLGPLFQQAASLEKGLSILKNANKFTRMAGYGAAAYTDWAKEKFEEGYQYAAQQRQHSEALDLNLYDNKGLMSNILSDSFDALQSLDYSPVGIVRDADGRYSHDPNFQFAEGSGGMLGLFGGGISIPIKVAKDLYLYNKVNKELKNDPFNDTEDKTFKLKSDILFNHISNDTVHHLVEGLKTLSAQKDVNGNPLLSKQDLDKEIGNIIIAKQKYDSVDNYINSFGTIFSSKELKEQKRLLKKDLFETVLRLTKYEGEINNLTSQKAKIRAAYSPVGQIMDINSQINIKEQYLKLLQNETEQKIDPDIAILHDFDKKVSILKKQIAKLKREQQARIGSLSEEDYKKYTAINLGKDLSKIEDYDPIADDTSLEQDTLNNSITVAELHKDFYADRYAEYRSMKSVKSAVDYINKRVADSEKKKDILEKNTPETKDEQVSEEETKETSTESPVVTEEGDVVEVNTKATAQRVGGLEEFPIAEEGIDDQGFEYFTIEKPDGTTEKVSQKEAWYKTYDINSKIEGRKDPRHVLQGVDHFLKPYTFNLSRESKVLQRVSKTLGKSVAEILKEFPKAFPAHANQALMNKIMMQPNPKDFIDITLTRKFAEKNLSQNPIVFESATGLIGVRVQGLTMNLRLTDPDDASNQLDLFEIYPPDFYALADGENLVPIDFTDPKQMDLEKFNTMFTDYTGKPFTKTQFDQFVRNWKSVKDFKTALETHLKNMDLSEPAVVDKEAYNISATGSFDSITDLKKPFSKMKASPVLREAPIYYFDTNPALNHWVTEATMQPGYQLDPGTVGYYAAANTKAGFRWVRLTPGKIIVPGERDEVVGAEMKRVVDALYDLDVNALDSQEKAKALIKSLKFFIASYNNYTITPFADNVNGHYVVKYTIEQGDRKIVVYFDKFLKSGAEVDYNYKFVIKRINDALSKSKLSVQINENNFRTNPPRDLSEKTYDGDVRDLFDITVEPDIVTNLSPRFHLGINKNTVSDKTPSVKPTPVNSAPKPTPKPAPAKPVSTEAKEETFEQPETLSFEEEIAIDNGFNNVQELLDAANKAVPGVNFQSISDLTPDFISQLSRERGLTEKQIAAGEASKQAQLKKMGKITSYKNQSIHDNFGGIREEDWVRYGDKNWLNPDFKKWAIDSKSLPLDVIVMEMSSAAGIEISIEDVIEYMKDRETRRTTPGSVQYRKGRKDYEEKSKKVKAVKKESLEENDSILKQPDNISKAEQEEKDREDGVIGDAFKIADKGDIDYPVSLAEQEEYLSSILPKDFTREDIKQLHTNVVKNGIVVGAVAGKTVYLRDVADKSDLFHEAFHVVFRNLLSDSRAQAYLNKVAAELNYSKEELEAAKLKLRASKAYEGYTEQQLEDQVYEEYLADNFFEWKKGQTKKSWLRQLFDKIMNLIRYFTNDDVRGLYAAIDRGYFKNSAVLKTKYNSDGSTNTAYKLLVGATQAQSSNIVNQILAKIFVDGLTYPQALNYFIEFYNPNSEENQNYIGSNPSIRQEFEKFQNLFLESANQRILHEVITKKLKSFGLDKQSLDQMIQDTYQDETDPVEESAERQWDLTDAYIDPYTRVGRKIKRIIETTTYTAYFNGKPYQKALDGRVFYSRMLPVLSVSNLDGNKIMDKLLALSKWDPQIKAFYERLVDLTGYDHTAGKPADYSDLAGVSGKQIYNSLIKAFEIEQMVYFEPVSNITEGKPVSNQVYTLNKIDLGDYKMTEWSNYWKTNVMGGLLQDKKAKNSVISSLDNFISRLTNKDSISAPNINGLKSALDKLGLKLEIPYLYYSFGTTSRSEDLRNNFSVRPMTIEDLVQIRAAVVQNDDLFGKTTAANKAGAQGRMLDIANANAVFDSNLVLKTYLDSENKVRYAYVSSNMTLAETRRLKTLLTSKAIEEEKAKNNGYFAFNPLLTDTNQAINIFSNLNIGLTNSFRTAVDKVDEATKKTKEIKDTGVTGKGMDPDTMVGVMHILFNATFQTKATKVKYARYWLSQISDKNTQYAVEMPVTRFWENGQFTDSAKEKLFNLVKQEYLRNQGKFGEAIKKDKFLYFPFLSPTLLQGTLENLEAQKDDIVNQIQSEFKLLAETHKKDLQERELMNGNTFTFLDNQAIEKEYKNVDNYLGNFITNHFIYTTGILQFYTGDIAWAKSWDDFVKRMAGAIASGNTLGNNDIMVVHTTDAVDYIDKSTLNPANQGEENAVENNTADAQVWSTVFTKKAIAEALGELSDTLNSALDKVIAGEDKSLTKEEKKELDLISDKLVGYGIDNDGNRQYNKQSTFYLTPGLTSMKDKDGNWVAQPHRVPLHNIRVYLENLSQNKQPVLLSPKSANKLYKSPTPINIRDFEGAPEKGKDKKIKADRKAITKVNGKYFRKQQENDTKEKDSIVFVRQLIDVLGSEIKDPKTRELIEQFRTDLAAIRNESFDFASKLIVNKVRDIYERADLETWLESLRHNIEISTPDSQMLEYLNLPDVDLNLPHLQNKTKTLFLNTFKSSFQKRINGRKCTLLSSYGFQVVVDKSTGKVVPTEEIVKSKSADKYNDTSKYEIRDLKIHKIDKDSEGNVVKQEAEFLMTRKTAEMMGINVSDPTKADYMKVFGVRIPLQSYHSTSVGRIVDFLPDYYGDVVVAPKEVVYLGGMDYDVDSLYMFLPNIFINQAGEKVLYGQESSQEEKFYGFKYYLIKNNSFIAREVYKELLNNDDFRALKLEPSMKEDLGEALDSSIIISILNGETKDKLIEQLTEEAISKVLTKFGYPGTLESFTSSRIESEGAVQNRIHNSIHTILMSEELADAYKQPANHDKIDNSIGYLEKIGALDPNRKANVIPNTPVSVSDAYANSIKGKDLTGIAVNANTVGATLTEYEVKLRDAAAIIFGAEKDEKGNLIGKRYVSFASDPQTHRTKADAGSTTVTGTVDNANKPVSRDLNFSRHTIPQRNILIQLGITDYEFIDSYFALPVIKELVKGFEGSSRAMSPTSFNLQVYKRNLMNKLRVLRDDMKARGDGAGADVSLLEHLDKEMRRANTKVFTKEELEKVHKLANSKFLKQPPMNMSSEELKNAFSYYMIQYVALDTYSQLSYISDYAQHVSKIMSLNRRLNPEMEVLGDYLVSVEQLISRESAFELDGVERILNNPNVSSNLKNVEEILNMSKLFFLDNTSFVSDFKEQATNSLVLRYRDYPEVQRNFISYVTMKALQHNTGKSYDEYYSLVIPGYVSGGKTLAAQFNDLIKTDNDGNPINPEFYNNPFVKILEPMMAKDNSSSAIDILGMDSRAKFSAETLDKYIDAIQAMFRSDNKDIRAFATNMLKYLAIKDTMQFKNYSFIKLLPATSFTKISEVLSTLNREVAYEKDSSAKLKQLTGKTSSELYREFLEIYSRLNPGKVRNIRLGDMDINGNPISDNFVTIKEGEGIQEGTYRVFDYKISNEELVLTQNITNFKILSELPANMLALVSNEGNEIFSLNFPSAMALNGNKAYIYVETSRKKEGGKVTVTYKKSWTLNTKGILPFAASVKATEKASQIISEVLRDKAKKRNLENVNEAAIRNEESSSLEPGMPATPAKKEAEVSQEQQVILTLKDGKDYHVVNINATMLTRMGYSPEEAGEIIKNLCK